jgi:hypothetical protein
VEAINVSRWTNSRYFWQWISIICYIGVLAFMGERYYNRIMPDLFFGILLAATAVLMIALRFIENKWAKTKDR